MNTLIDPFVRCTGCGWTGKESELIASMLAPQTRLEPADVQHSCPACRRDDNWIETIDDSELCEGCGEDVKYSDGKNEFHHCHDCLVSAAEYMAEPDR